MSDSESDSPSKLFYALLSVTIVSLASLLGGIILPCTTGKSRRLWMHFFIAMAVGTLSSDSILHLIPEVLGIHDHSHSSHSVNGTTTTISPLSYNESDHNDSHDHDHHHRIRRHSHEEHDEHEHGEGNGMRKERQMLLKLLCLLCAVYILYLIEFVAYFRTDGSGHSHGHSHGTAEVNEQAVYVEKPIPVWDIESSCSPSSSSTSVGPPPLNQVSPLLAAPPVFCGLRGPALIILFGDGVHNFIDGVAIGASFASSFGTGVATSIAVLCHELPHELGDMAVLLETGLSMYRALLLNLLSALTAYAGLFVGFYAVSIDSAKTWLLALTAGMFLYVAWIDMLSHLKHEAAEKLDPWWLTCLLQFAGLFFGTSIMFALGWFEHDLFADNH